MPLSRAAKSNLAKALKRLESCLNTGEKRKRCLIKEDWEDYAKGKSV
jgi:hypothetical protein